MSTFARECLIILIAIGLTTLQVIVASFLVFGIRELMEWHRKRRELADS